MLGWGVWSNIQRAGRREAVGPRETQGKAKRRERRPDPATGTLERMSKEEEREQKAREEEVQGSPERKRESFRKGERKQARRVKEERDQERYRTERLGELEKAKEVKGEKMEKATERKGEGERGTETGVRERPRVAPGEAPITCVAPPGAGGQPCSQRPCAARLAGLIGLAPASHSCNLRVRVRVCVSLSRSPSLSVCKRARVGDGGRQASRQGGEEEKGSY